MYYLSKNTDKIFTEAQISIVNDIYGEGELERCLETETFVPIEEPSVIDLIMSKNMPAAAIRYREIHNCKLKAAYDTVYQMRRDIYRFNKRNSKKEEKCNG